jgi:hypothetical protein
MMDGHMMDGHMNVIKHNYSCRVQISVTVSTGSDTTKSAKYMYIQNKQETAN